MTNNVIVYSAVTSNYDMVFKPKVYTENVNYILFSDQQRKVKGWEVAPMVDVMGESALLTNRWYKFFPHKLFKNVEYSIYIDGNIRITGDLSLLIQEFKESRAALGVFRHPNRTNILEEADACVAFGKFDDQDKSRVKSQLEMYFESGMPVEQPLTDNGIIFRWHKHPKLLDAMSSWWDNLQDFSKRDQLSLPYIIWKNDLPVKIWDWTFRDVNIYFDVYLHRRSLIWDLRIIIFIYRNDCICFGIANRLMDYVRQFFK